MVATRRRRCGKVYHWCLSGRCRWRRRLRTSLQNSSRKELETGNSPVGEKASRIGDERAHARCIEPWTSWCSRQQAAGTLLGDGTEDIEAQRLAWAGAEDRNGVFTCGRYKTSLIRGRGRKRENSRNMSIDSLFAFATQTKSKFPFPIASINIEEDGIAPPLSLTSFSFLSFLLVNGNLREKKFFSYFSLQLSTEPCFLFREVINGGELIIW